MVGYSAKVCPANSARARWIARALPLLRYIAFGSAMLAVSAQAAPSLQPGHYSGHLAIHDLHKCADDVLGKFRPELDAVTDAFVTINSKGAQLVLGGEEGNTESANYFETSDGSLAISAGQIVGKNGSYSFNIGLQEKKERPRLFWKWDMEFLR